MLISPYRVSSIWHLVWLLASLWASPGDGAAIQPPALTLEDPSGDNHTDTRLFKRGATGLNGILAMSYDEKTMLDPKGAVTRTDEHGNEQVMDRAHDSISSVDRGFGSEPWTISYFNGNKNYVILIITAKGASIVKIPVQKAKDSSMANEVSLANENKEYDRTIKEPLLRSDGLLSQTLRDWMQDGQTDQKNWWFPDGIRIIAVGPFSTSYNQFLYPGAFRELQKDVRERWRKAGKAIPNILGDDPSEDDDSSPEEPRLEELKLPWKPVPDPTWHDGAKSAHGFAISWTPSADASSGEYEIWVGSTPTGTKNPWRKETLVKRTWGDPSSGSHNWGYYPEGVLPYGYPFQSGPGAGCYYDSDSCAL